MAEPPTPKRKALLATCGVKPEMRHSRVARDFINDVTLDDESDWKDTLNAFVAEGTAPPEEKLKTVSRMLASQAITLDTIFTNMAQRAAANIGQYPDAVDHYIRHALKAQAGSRATLEALAKLHQPREQIVKHVNVNEGGQVVVAGQIHQHQQPGLNHENASQPYGPSAPLLGQDPQGHGVPVARDEGQEAMPTARRYVSGRAHRTSER